MGKNIIKTRLMPKISNIYSVDNCKINSLSYGDVPTATAEISFYWSLEDIRKYENPTSTIEELLIIFLCQELAKDESIREKMENLLKK